MDFKAQDYKSALNAWKEWKEAKGGPLNNFAEHCQANIKALSKPVKYKLISDAWPFDPLTQNTWKLGDISDPNAQQSVYRPEQFPFHWKEVPETEPITMQEVLDALYRLNWHNDNGPQLIALTDRIEQEHDLTLKNL